MGEQSRSHRVINSYIYPNGLGLTNLPGEVWKGVPDSKGRYQISNKGRLKTFRWCGSNQVKIMNPAPDKGYLKTVIVINGKNKNVNLHRLTAQAFIPNPDNKPQVNHKDCNKRNNDVTNLEWVTNRENVMHAIANGRYDPYEAGNLNKKYLPHHKGEDVGTAKLKEWQVKEIRARWKPYKHMRESLAKEFNVKPATIKDVVLRKSWKHVKLV